MKSNKILLISIVLLAILSLGAVSAHDNATDDVSSPAKDDLIQLNLDDNSKLSDYSSMTYDKAVYVNTTGSDSGAGSEASPYATINKAINDVNASDNAVIYLGSGTFSGDGNADLTVNLAHKNYGGSLTFIGVSDGTTKIDGGGITPIFKSISADSIVIFKNIVFTNGKNNLGSAITAAGNLTVENCVFEDNYATTLGALYFNAANDFNVINTTFKNNYGGNGYADLYYSYSGVYTARIIDCKFIGSKAGNTNLPSFSVQNSVTYIVGNTFEDLTGGSTSGTFLVSYGSTPKYVINNTFINCNFTGTGAGGIFATQNSYLENNIFINCTTKSAQIYAQTEFNARIKFLNASIDGTTFRLYANVTDDVGNLITAGGSVHFFIEGVEVGTSTVDKGVASVSVTKLLENGNYTISGNYAYSNNPFEIEVENGTAMVNFNHNPLEIWISPNGNDTNGTGSEDNPFLTLKHALDYGFSNSVDLTVHVKDGVYNGSSNRGLSYSPVGKLTIIGESYGNAIIDAEKAAASIFTFGANLDVKITNLTLLNTTGRVINVFKLELYDSIIKNVGGFYAQDSYRGKIKILLNNLTYENSGALQMYNPTIYNSLFINNNGNTATGLIWASSNDNNIVDIQNTTFINNRIAGSSGGAALYVQSTALLINNRYERNTVTGDGKFIVYCSGNKIVSINETFIGNNATSYVGQYYSIGTNPTLKIENIQFVNNTASGDGAALSLHGGNVTGAKFINNTAGGNGGAIYLLYHSTSTNVQNLVLTDVTFENNKATRGIDIFIQEPTSTSYVAGVLENITITAESKTIELLADTLTVTLTHNSGAIIGGGKITFYIDGKSIGTSNVNNGNATFEYVGFKNGTYSFTESYSLDASNYEHISGTITVTLKPLLDNITLYVSDSRGDDANGDGSYDNPYKTIQTALSNGYSQSLVVIVNVLEGNYIGEKNVNLNIPTGVDITLNGAGVDKTIINDGTADYFFKALAGDGLLTVSNLTMDRSAKRLNQMINILEGATVILDNVYVTRGIGNDGGAISSAGTLIIRNSYFYNNGLGEKSFSSRAGGAIYNTGTLLIYNTTFYANHASGAVSGLGGAVIYNTGDLEIYSSILNDSICDYGLNMAYMAIQGTATSTIKMYDTIVTITGRTAAEILPTDLYNLNGRAVPTIGIGQAATGIFVNCTFDGANVLNHGGSIVFGNLNNWNPVYIRNITVVNSTFKNLKSPTVVYGANAANTPESYRVFDNCVFDNVQFLYAVLVNTNKVHITINNSVILPSGTQMIGTMSTPIAVVTDISNNWWGDNSGVYDLTTITRTNGGANAFYTINPNVRTTTDLDQYLALTATKDDNSIILEFKGFDGESYSEYAGKLNRVFTISAVNGTLGVENGTINNKVIIPFEATDLRYSIKINVDNEEIIMAFDERNATVLDVVGIDKDLGIITLLTDINGNAIPNAKIDYSIGEISDRITTDEKGIAVIPCVANGELTINFAETSELLGSNTTFNIDGVVKADVPLIITVPDEIEIGDNVAIIVEIKNATGNVTLYVDGVPYELELNSGIANHIIEGISEGNHTILAIYAGNDLISPVVNITTINNIAKKESKAQIETENMEIGKTGTITVTIPEATGSVKIIFDGDAETVDLVDGIATRNVEKLTAGDHTIIVIYDGDEKYAATNEIKPVVISKKDTPISVTAPETSIIGKSTTVAVNIDESASGTVIFTIGDKNIAITLDEAKSVNFIFDEAGSYDIYAKYLGDDYFNANTTETVTINVAGKKESEIDIAVPEDIKVGDDVNIIISIENATGEAIVIFDGKQTSENLENGIIDYKISAIKSGVHSISVIYNGDENNTDALNSKTFTVNKETTTGNITIPIDYKVDETINVTVSIPGVSGNVTVIVDGFETTVTLDENGTGSVPLVASVGEHSAIVVYLGDEGHTPFYAADSIYVEVLSTSFVNITISGDLKISAVLVNALGDSIANATIFYTIDGVKYNTTTDAKGSFSIQGVANKLIAIEYEGDNHLLATGTTIDLNNMAPAKSNTALNVEKSSLTSYTVETVAGEKGSEWFVATLKDDKGVLANADVQFVFDGKTYTMTTDSNGQVKFQINAEVAKTYTGTFVYLGDETHNAAYAMVTVNVNEKTVQIVAKSKTFKAKTKTKKLVVTLKTIVGSAADKKAHIQSGKVLYLKVKGKTYKAKTDDKGKATFKITKLNKKGKYSAKITFKATSIYKGATKKVKIKIK